MAIVIVQAKSTQKWYFLVSNPIFQKFSLGALVPHPFLCKKNWVKLVPKQVFIGVGGIRPPPTVVDSSEALQE